MKEHNIQPNIIFGNIKINRKKTRVSSSRQSYYYLKARLVGSLYKEVVSRSNKILGRNYNKIIFCEKYENRTHSIITFAFFYTFNLILYLLKNITV